MGGDWTGNPIKCTNGVCDQVLIKPSTEATVVQTVPQRENHMNPGVVGGGLGLVGVLILFAYVRLRVKLEIAQENMENRMYIMEQRFPTEIIMLSNRVNSLNDMINEMPKKTKTQKKQQPQGSEPQLMGTKRKMIISRSRDDCGPDPM